LDLQRQGLNTLRILGGWPANIKPNLLGSMKCRRKKMKLRANPSGQPCVTTFSHPDVHRRNTMGSTGDKVKGMANEAAGNVKQGVGKATGNDKMRAEGVVQEKKGEAQQAVGKAKDAVKKGVDKA
jgi:uncharacterized protein YjbJ (UPF0337 family)